jgi:hypothetical protein
MSLSSSFSASTASAGQRIDVPVVAYGTPQIGTLLREELGCRRWDAFDSELDLGGLCLTVE